MASLGTTVLLAACWDVPAVDRRTLTEWLVCGDCTSSEFDRVVGNGPRMIPYLESALMDGPTAQQDSLVRRQGQETVARGQRYRLSRGIVGASTADSAEAVQRYVDGFRLTYRLRAATALARLDSARARALVGRFCLTNSPELVRHPEFKASFAAIAPCP